MSESRTYSATETLRNGRQIEIRALRPEDRDDFIRAAGGLSAQSLYRRFFAPKRHYSEEEKSFFLDVDFVNHVALIALTNVNGKVEIIGGGRYVVDHPGSAEVAFTVIDKYQAQGIGAALMRHLITVARQAGLRELFAEVLRENAAMLKVFERCGLPMQTRAESQTLHVVLALN